MRFVVVEPDQALRPTFLHRFASLGDAFRVAGSIEEAQDLASRPRPCTVMARNPGGAALAAAMACGFDLGAAPLRLVLVATDQARAFYHEVDRMVAELQLPRAVPAKADLVPEDFPHSTYQVQARLGGADCAGILLVRHRISGQKELLVQVQECAAAEQVAHALYGAYRNLRLRGKVAGKVLRHELTRNHSYIAPGSLPLEFARVVEAASYPPREALAC